MNQVVTDDVSETHTVAKKLLAKLKKRPDSATVLAFSGQLGAGKTEFIRGLLKAAGVTDPVTSPTYTIETVYDLPESVFSWAVHIDAYRLKNSQDLLDLDFKSRLANRENLIVIEWAPRVEDELPQHAVKVAISIQNDKRLITIDHEQTR